MVYGVDIDEVLFTDMDRRANLYEIKEFTFNTVF